MQALLYSRPDRKIWIPKGGSPAHVSRPNSLYDQQYDQRW